MAMVQYRNSVQSGKETVLKTNLFRMRDAIDQYYADKGIWPAASTDVMGNTKGKYTTEISITTGAGISGNLVLTAKMNTANVNTQIADQTVTLATTDGGKTWSCVVGTMNTKYVPAACR